jgi:hypothetical protein
MPGSAKNFKSLLKGLVLWASFAPYGHFTAGVFASQAFTKILHGARDGLGLEGGAQGGTVLALKLDR